MKQKIKLSILFVILCTALNVTHASASTLMKSKPTSVGNVLTSPLNIVLHKNGSLAYVSAPECRCILFIDFSQQFPMVSFDDQINVPGLRDIGPLAINHIENELYVIDTYQSLYVIDTQTNVIDTTPFEVSKYPNRILVSKDGQTLFVCARHAVDMIYAKNKIIEATIELDGINPYGATLAKNKLYVVEEFGDTVYIIDLIEQSITKSINVSDYSYDLIASPDETRIYCSHGIKGIISVINTATDTLEKTITLEGDDKCPQGMTIHSSILYVANYRDGTISRINMMTNQEIICPSSLLSGDKNPESLICSSNGKQLYVVHPIDESIMIVDLPTTCPSIKKDLDHSVFNDEREKTLFILETDICENQPITFTVSTDKPELFSMQPIISPTGEMLYQPNIKNSGKARVEISIIDPLDDCSASESFDITIIATGYKLKLEKKGRGEIKITDGEDNPTTLTPWESMYLKNTSIRLSAIPQENYVFAGWSKGMMSLSNPLDIILTKDLVLRANFLDVTAYAIIIQGKRSDEEGLPSHGKTCDLAWQTFIQNGVDVKYLKYDDQGRFDRPSVDAVKQAITQWAFEKMKGKGSTLTILFVGHGSEDIIYIDGEIVQSSLLNDWITQLQFQLDENFQQNTIITVIGACHSGSFVNELSGENRIIITSSDAHEMAFKGPLIDNGMRQGDFFVAELVKNIGQGYSIKDSFMEASLLTERFTYRISNSFVSQYHDQSMQHPLLDDNSDHQGSNDLYHIFSNEGIHAQSVWIGNSHRKRSMPYTSDRFVRETLIIDETINTTSYTLQVAEPQSYSQFWIDIKPPDFSIENLPQDTDQLEMNNYRQKRTLFDDESAIVWENVQGFSSSGEYQVLFFGQHKETSLISLLKEVNAYKKNASNHPPSDFSTIRPKNNDDVQPVYYPVPEDENKYICALEWENAIDPDGDLVFYTVWISTSPHFVNPIIINNLLVNQALLTIYDEAPFGSTDSNILILDYPYYWKVQAFDPYGNFSKETDPVKFTAKNPNIGSIGCFEAILQDALDQHQILAVESNISKKNAHSEFAVSKLNGQYFISGSRGTFSVLFEANGYQSAESEIDIPEGCSEYPPKRILFLTRHFDLADIISALQLLTHFKSEVSKKWEINNDEKISLNDVIYMMNQIGQVSGI